ncbi:MAG: EamA family transporter [Thermosulfidibacteraceae bacterium]|jgi:uncharacterized membrane protein
MSETWFLFAFLAAFSWATSDLINKIGMSKGENEYNALMSRFLWAIPLIALFYLSKSDLKIPNLNAFLYITIVILGDIAASLLYMKALKMGEISVVAPLTSFAPVFMVLSSIIVLHEPPSLIPLAGIILVCLGSYILGIEDLRQGFTKPIKNILKSKAGIFTIAAAFIFSIDTSIAKISLRYTDVYSFSLWYTVTFTLTFIVLSKALKKPLDPKGIIFKKKTLLIGILFGIGTVSFMKAIESTNISYVSSVGKLNLIISVIYGKIFFNEKHFKNRLLGTIIIIIGVALVTYGSNKT